MVWFRVWYQVQQSSYPSYRHWNWRSIQQNYLRGKYMSDSEKEIPKTREEILRINLDARVQEVMHYQINIDNYTLALENIASMNADERAELSGFADQLRGLLASEKLEQKKAKVMLAVLQQQLED
jgi:hypothetical protein